MNRRLAEVLGGINQLAPIILRQQPNGRMLSTREIGNAVAFLALDEASGTTGAALYVDGGRRLRFERRSERRGNGKAETAIESSLAHAPWHRETVQPVMIKSFGDQRTQNVFQDWWVREFQGFARIAKRKLALVNAAGRPEDLRVPPGNHLETLHGALERFHSIRINGQWRVVSRWSDGHAHDVRILD